MYGSTLSLTVQDSELFKEEVTNGLSFETCNEYCLKEFCVFYIKFELRKII